MSLGDEIAHLKDDAFAFEDLVFGVAVFSHVDKLVDAVTGNQSTNSKEYQLSVRPSVSPRSNLVRQSPRSQDLFILCRNKHRRNADQLKLDERDDSLGKESIDNVDCDPEGFGEHVVSKMNLKKPVDEGSSHAPVRQSEEIGPSVYVEEGEAEDRGIQLRSEDSPLNLALVIHVVRVRHDSFLKRDKRDQRLISFNSN